MDFNFIIKIKTLTDFMKLLVIELVELLFIALME